MKEKKDLAEEYAIKAYKKKTGMNEIVIRRERLYNSHDLMAAFNAGRESVLESCRKAVDAT